MHKGILLAGALAFGFAGAAQAQWAPSPRAPSSDALSDDFAQKAAAGGLAEVEAGRLAQTKAGDKAVRNLAARMVRDHAKANSELMRILQKSGRQPPSGLDADGRSMMDKLNSASGREFDRAYITAMVEDHDKDVQAFSECAKSCGDRAVKAFAAKTLTVIRRHDKAVQDLQRKMSSTGSL